MYPQACPEEAAPKRIFGTVSFRSTQDQTVSLNAVLPTLRSAFTFVNWRQLHREPAGTLGAQENELCWTRENIASLANAVCAATGGVCSNEL